jgi:hypothetical protein
MYVVHILYKRKYRYEDRPPDGSGGLEDVQVLEDVGHGHQP